jgi:hypothetical protein
MNQSFKHWGDTWQIALALVTSSHHPEAEVKCLGTSLLSMDTQ